MATPIALQCAWCGAQMREGPPPPASTSHGICGACLERFHDDPATAEDDREAAASSAAIERPGLG